jgi:hypothetical protein
MTVADLQWLWDVQTPTHLAAMQDTAPMTIDHKTEAL